MQFLTFSVSVTCARTKKKFGLKMELQLQILASAWASEYSWRKWKSLFASSKKVLRWRQKVEISQITFELNQTKEKKQDLTKILINRNASSRLLWFLKIGRAGGWKPAIYWLSFSFTQLQCPILYVLDQLRDNLYALDHSATAPPSTEFSSFSSTSLNIVQL